MKSLEKAKPIVRPAGPKAPTKPTRLVSICDIEDVVIHKRVAVRLKVPEEIAKSLSKSGEYLAIPSAAVDDGQEAQRINQWRNDPHGPISRKRRLKMILKMKRDTVITIRFEAETWRRIKSVCEFLDISTCDWLLAAAHYNASVNQVVYPPR